MSAREPGVVQRTRLKLPIRLKLAVVSAGLTFAILLLFALVVGSFTEQRLRANFDNDIRATGSDLQERLRIQRNLAGDPIFAVSQDATLRAAAAGGASIRVVDRSGRVIAEAGRPAELGAPVEGVRDVGDFRVVARPLFAGSLDRSGGFKLSPSPIDGAVAFVQYAKARDSLDVTANRLHVFFLFGVLGGTGLAFLAGAAVARRAMRPIAELTTAAREVARTRDPGRTLPRPAADDEVAELATTLDEMLGELNAARGETEASLERQREFVADASHELRTPLTSILANLELLESELERAEGPRDREAAAEIAGSALRSSRRMRRLVGDLRLLARADAGRRSQPRPVDLAAAVRDAAAEAEPISDGHPLSLDLPAEPGAAMVEGSADDLHRLALNLIENAFLHTPNGTPVIASVRVEGRTVALEVADRGPGVTPDRRERVFERFARSGGDRSSSGGSGLGLTIVRSVSEAHGGTVGLSEAKGGGALFRVTFPAPAADSTSLDRDARAGEKPARAPR